MSAEHKRSTDPANHVRRPNYDFKGRLWFKCTCGREWPCSRASAEEQKRPNSEELSLVKEPYNLL